MANVRLDKDFEAPVLKARLEVALILARVLREELSNKTTITALEESLPLGWIGLTKVLGSVLANPDYLAENIDDVWKAFVLHKNIRGLTETQPSVVGQMRQECHRIQEGGDNVLVDLKVANEQAHTFVRRILTRNGIQHLMPPAPVPIKVFFDAEASAYCASTSRLTGVIRWAYQPVPHALLGLIIPEFIISHEYLSHLVPSNRYLDNHIREQWLVAALAGAYRDARTYPRWKLRLWPAFRKMLTDHVVRTRSGVGRDTEAGSVSSFGFEGVEQASDLLYSKNRRLFWRLTAEMLEHETDTPHAELASWVAYHLVGQNLSGLRPNKVQSLNDLHLFLKKQLGR
ncbi:MAG TPA: hypothetical protein VJX67_14900 [Blastocatellia bacterium]|nr:hypothetical protein [Blastocatellia bacterium]